MLNGTVVLGHNFFPWGKKVIEVASQEKVLNNEIRSRESKKEPERQIPRL